MTSRLVASVMHRLEISIKSSIQTQLKNELLVLYGGTFSVGIKGDPLSGMR